MAKKALTVFLLLVFGAIVVDGYLDEDTGEPSEVSAMDGPGDTPPTPHP